MPKTTTKEVQTVHETPPAGSGARALSLVDRIVWFVIGVILVLLAFRFLLTLFGANTANSFANFIYSASHPLVAPFFGLFNYNYAYGVSTFEIYTLVAMLVYIVIGWLVSMLLAVGRE